MGAGGAQCPSRSGHVWQPDKLKHRVHELLRENRWRGRIGFVAMVVIALMGLILLSLASTRLEFQPRSPDYQSTAKLVAGGSVVVNQGKVGWKEQLNDFYGTIIETLESAEMKKRAWAHVRIFNPNLKEPDVDIRVTQVRNSALFNVFVTGKDPKFMQSFLDALLDEFIAFRHLIREQGLERALNTFTETVVKKSKELQDCTEKQEAFRMKHPSNTLKSQVDEAQLALKTAKDRVRQIEQRLADLQIMKETPDRVLANFEKGLSADGSLKMGEQSRLSLTEQSYLKARVEVLSLGQELSFLKQTASANAAEIRALVEKEAKANHVASAWLSTLEADSEKEMAVLTRQLQVLKTEHDKARLDALKAGALLAEEERLEEEFKAAKLMHDEMFKKVQNFQDFQNVQTDFVAIQERASVACPLMVNRGIQVWKLWSKAEP